MSFAMTNRPNHFKRSKASGPPMVLVSPDIQARGKEFGDLSISLSRNYERALIAAGVMPLVMPATASAKFIAESVRRCNGVLLTGGDDLEPRLYANGLTPRVRRTVEVTPDGGERDFRELLIVNEVFRQRKALLAICRGHQLVNVALGGTLLADIRTQVPHSLAHQRLDLRDEPVHEVQLTPASVLAKITGRKSLSVNSTHHQALGRVAPPLQVSSVSIDGIIESTELRPDVAGLLPFFLTVQFHPERLADRYAEHRAIFRAFARACTIN
jgi:putative glutamine amidotransferase